jgi:hypothetical protein
MPMIQTTRGTAEWPPLKKMFDYLYADLKKFAVEWVPSDVLPMQK